MINDRRRFTTNHEMFRSSALQRRGNGGKERGIGGDLCRCRMLQDSGVDGKFCSPNLAAVEMPLSSTFSTAAGATELRGWKVASSSKDGTACALSCCGAGHWQPRTCVGYGALAPRLLVVLIMIYSSGKHCLPARSIHVYKKKIPPFNAIRCRR